MAQKKINNNVSIILGFVFTVLIIFFAYKAFAFVYVNLDKLNANVVVAALAGTFTITGFFITRFLERKKIIEQQIREQKIPIYQEFIDFIFKVFSNTKANSTHKVSDKEMEDFFWTLNKKSILWLSDNTLKSYTTWKSGLSKITDTEEDPQTKSLRLLLEFEKLLLDFRKDIGHKNKNINSGDILSLFVNDWNISSKGAKL